LLWLNENRPAGTWFPGRLAMLPSPAYIAASWWPRPEFSRARHGLACCPQMLAGLAFTFVFSSSTVLGWSL
jgi:hypothetical protein